MDIYTERTENYKESRTLLVLDDLGQELRHDIDMRVLNLLVSNSRHLHISIVHLCQKLTQSPTIFRANADVIVMFSAASMIEREALYREVSVCDKKTFFGLLNKATANTDHGFLCSCIGTDGQLRLYNKDMELLY